MILDKPKFTWWPLKALALAVPVLSAALSFACSANSPHQPIPLFFCLLGAGNGYLIGIAIGDLGRSMIAIPLGALAGYFLSFALVSVFRPEDPQFWFCCFFLYPLILASITAVMPLRKGVFDIYSAGCAGFYSGLRGLLVGFIAFLAWVCLRFCLSLGIWGLKWLFFPSSGFVFGFLVPWFMSDSLTSLFAWVAIALANLSAIDKLLALGYRTSPPLPENPPDVPAEVFAIPARESV
jgi:hypothetical protein